MTIKFTPDDAVVGADEDTGDVAVYAGGSAASFYRGAWHPDIVFNRHELISEHELISKTADSVPRPDPADVQRYLDAAHDVLLQCLAMLETEENP